MPGGSAVDQSLLQKHSRIGLSNLKTKALLLRPCGQTFFVEKQYEYWRIRKYKDMVLHQVFSYHCNKISIQHHLQSSRRNLQSIIMKFSLVVAALGIPCALALPSPSGDGNSLVARANPKLNQYSSLDDW